MKKTKYPNLRTHVRRGKSGQVWTYWTYDRRSEGLPELPLGRDSVSNRAMQMPMKINHLAAPRLHRVRGVSA